MQYRTSTNEMLDAICYTYYNGRSGAVEAVLEANPGLAKLGPVLPLNTRIELPDLGAADESAAIKLWE